MTEIIMVWQPSQHLNGVQGRSELPPFCISAMILLVLQNNSLIDVLFNIKYCLLVKFIFSVFIFKKKSWQSHQNVQNSSAKVSRIPAKLLRKKNKTYLGFGL